MISESPAYQWGGSYAVAAFVLTGALMLFVLPVRRRVLIGSVPSLPGIENEAP
ncbi:MAG TPA: hypothetical protein VFC14_10885 [Burkholderiales bacterium]|jgi:hypothetical protein|nr:hypothetical protein [Burkholderiales bacterium]